MDYIYCDNAATTRPRDEVIELTAKVMSEAFGNPSSLHAHGNKAKSYIETAREQCAKLINSTAYEILFTSGGTDSNNIAIRGSLSLIHDKKHIITTIIEHSSVYKTFQHLEKNLGYKVTWLGVDEQGFIDLNELSSAINEETALVSIMHANNEIGTVQNLEAIGAICKSKNVLFHTDAVQSAAKVPIDVKKANVDLLSVSAHKIYGPKGVGFLFKRRGVELAKIAYGGSQEQNLIPGTENVSGIASLGLAAELASKELDIEANRLRSLQAQIFDYLANCEGVYINGTTDLSRRVPGNINFSLENLSGEASVMRMNLKGVCVSSGSACSEGKIEPSRVITAIRRTSKELAYNSVRMSLGKFNTEKDLPLIIDTISSLLGKSVNKASK
jgi:cysteine desulfurase